MPSDLRVLRITTANLSPVEGCTRALTEEDLADLALAYLDAYPPEIGAPDLRAATTEIRDAFAGVYGQLIPTACLGALVDGRVVGAVLTTTHSIWDDIEGPFVIDLFVHRGHRGHGLARALMAGVIRACSALEAGEVSLRVGEGTSPQAYTLYRHLGFVDPSE